MALTTVTLQNYIKSLYEVKKVIIGTNMAHKSVNVSRRVYGKNSESTLSFFCDLLCIKCIMGKKNKILKVTIKSNGDSQKEPFVSSLRLEASTEFNICSDTCQCKNRRM